MTETNKKQKQQKPNKHDFEESLRGGSGLPENVCFVFGVPFVYCFLFVCFCFLALLGLAAQATKNPQVALPGDGLRSLGRVL